MGLRLVETQGTLDNIQAVKVQGIVTRAGECISVKIYDAADGQPISWGMNQSTIEGFARIIEAI